MPDESGLEEMRKMAAAIGLTRLSEEHLRQLARATRTAEARRAALPTADLAPTDEPAHVFVVARRAGP
jgi:hypothetical protein